MFAARNMMFATSDVSYDADAATYFAAIASAGSTISGGNKAAVNAFVVGCKADGIWTAIKASCLLAGPDDLTGALVPLVGPAPTNVGGNFVDGDYNRTTGLNGSGTQYLTSNRLGDADLQDNSSMWVYITSPPVSSTLYAGTSSLSKVLLRSDTQYRAYLNGGIVARLGTPLVSTGFFGVSRSSSANVIMRSEGSNATLSSTSAAPVAQNISIFTRGTSSPRLDGRMSAYGIGESLDLALLDARLTTYMASLT
jgi:hypothetical protein